MDLFEYQGKQYFAKFGIPVSAGGVAVTVDEAVKVADASQYPVVVKAQVQVGGRGKAGGIKLPTTPTKCVCMPEIFWEWISKATSSSAFG